MRPGFSNPGRILVRYAWPRFGPVERTRCANLRMPRQLTAMPVRAGADAPSPPPLLGKEIAAASGKPCSRRRLRPARGRAAGDGVVAAMSG